jgi:LysR family transcriptional regulator of beta-lactamase
MQLPLNALRMFDAAARHLNLTHAAQELHVTQAAVSQHIRRLEDWLGHPLFKRLPRGLALTDEGQSLWPVVQDSLGRLERAFTQLRDEHPREVLTLGVVGTFAVGWLLPRLPAFEAQHPQIDLRLQTHNNRVDLNAEGLDAAIRFGDGAWPGLQADLLVQAPLTPLCAPAIAERLRQPGDLRGQPLLRSFRSGEWEQWCLSTGLPPLRATGPMFDSSIALAEAAALGAGVALLPPAMFAHLLRAGRLVQPFATTVPAGAYWFTTPKTRPSWPALAQLRQWLLQQAA